MPIVQIEHPVQDYDRWKQAFDSDPIDRRGSGVQRYRILRPIDDPKYVIVELELLSDERAHTFVAALRTLWSGVQGTFMDDPQARVLHEVEAVEVSG